MLVAHGNEDGLVMKISPHIPFSAGVSVIKWLPVAADVFELIDSGASTAPNQGLLNAWAHVAAMFEGQGDETAAERITDRIAHDLLTDSNNDRDPNGLVHKLKTTERVLPEVAALTRAVRDASLARIELRACNIGSGPGIAALRSFFACNRLMAPKVYTFYVQVSAPDNSAKQLALAAKAAPPGWRIFLGDPLVFPLNPPRFSNPFVRPFRAAEPEGQAVVPGPSTSRSRSPGSRRRTTEARRAN